MVNWAYMLIFSSLGATSKCQYLALQFIAKDQSSTDDLDMKERACLLLSTMCLLQAFYSNALRLGRMVCDIHIPFFFFLSHLYLPFKAECDWALLFPFTSLAELQDLGELRVLFSVLWKTSHLGNSCQVVLACVYF